MVQELNQPGAVNPLPLPCVDRGKQGGFTLIEMIVVVFIIGIIATFAVSNIGRDPEDLVEDEARRLHALLQLASEEAILKSRELAIEFHSDGYRFLELQTSGDNWRWMPITDDRIFRKRCLEGLVRMEVSLEGEETDLEEMGCGNPASDLKSDVEKENGGDKEKQEKEYPRIFLLSSGELTPFEIVLPVNKDGDAYRLIGKLQGEVQYLRPGEDADEV